MSETWRSIVGYEGIYDVSDNGRIKSLARKDIAGRQLRNRVLKPRVTRGYEYVELYKGGRSKNKRVHRLVLDAFVGSCPDDMECRHLDGNSRNNNLDNLQWGTIIENRQDSVLHGTIPRGGSNGQAKLMEEDVIWIRQLGAPQEKIARCFGVSVALVSLIKSRKRWRHVT